LDVFVRGGVSGVWRQDGLVRICAFEGHGGEDATRVWGGKCMRVEGKGKGKRARSEKENGKRTKRRMKKGRKGKETED